MYGGNLLGVCDLGDDPPACYYGERKRSAGARRWVSLIDIMNYSIGVEKVNEPRSYETYGSK